MRSALLAAILAALALLAMPGAASAGEFSIFTCFDDPNQEGLAFDGSLEAAGMDVKPACLRQGPGMRGMVTANATGRHGAERGALARVEIAAPDGTYFSQLRWWGKHRRADCRYGVELFADDGQGRNVHPVQKLAPRRQKTSCLERGRPQSGYNADPTGLRVAGDPTPGWWPIPGTSRIVQQLKCAAPRGERCSRRSLNYLRTFGLVANVTDPNPPAIAVGDGGDLRAGRWVNGRQQLNYGASDNVGIRSVDAVLLADGRSPSEEQVGLDPRPCATVQPRGEWSLPAYRDQYPCGERSLSGTVEVDTLRAVEGTRQLVLRATDVASNATASAPTTVRIDRTPPAKVAIDVEGGQGWHNTERLAIAWSNPGEGDAAPIDGVYYQTRPAGGTDWSQPQLAAGAVDRLEVKAPEGQTELRLWRRDQAGNESQQLGASDPVTLRYDGEAPQLGFEPPPAEDPTRVSVAVTDRVSGLAGGAIELRRQGTDSWLALATQQEGSRLVARVDDAALPAGQYVLRARALDQARNEASTDRRLDGQPMVLNLPLRVATQLRAGVERVKTVRKKVRRRGRTRRLPRRVHVLASRVRARLDRRVEVTGVLTDQHGNPLAGQPVQAYWRSRVDAAEQPAGVVTTDGQGRFSYTLAAGSSGTLRVAYQGAALTLPAQSEVQLRVPGSSSIGASRRRILNGQTVIPRPRALAADPRWREDRRAAGAPEGRGLDDLPHAPQRRPGALEQALHVLAHELPGPLAHPRAGAEGGRLPVRGRRLAAGADHRQGEVRPLRRSRLAATATRPRGPG
jgi:hypothetical protein